LGWSDNKNSNLNIAHIYRPVSDCPREIIISKRMHPAGYSASLQIILPGYFNLPAAISISV
jgi:hypothetical protein